MLLFNEIEKLKIFTPKTNKLKHFDISDFVVMLIGKENAKRYRHRGGSIFVIE